jgi:glucose-1-phosphate thymidylyltransferase
MLQYALEYVCEAGIREVGIVTNREGLEVQKVFGDGSQFDLQITYIPQEAPLGLAHVIKISQDFIKDEPFVFYLGDNILVGGIKHFIEEFHQKRSSCHLVLAKVKDPERFGVPEIQGNKIVCVEEKPKKPKSDYAVTGIYIYDSNIFEAVNNISPSSRGEMEISDAHQYLLDHDYTVTFSEITGWWKDTGKPLDLLEANRLVLDNLQPAVNGIVNGKSYIAGKVSIGHGSEIKDSNVRGPVIIGNNTLIENAYIGPYTSIGDRVVLKNSEVEFSIILEDCAILDVNIRIESSLLGKDVQIVKADLKPKTHRFIIGDQSRIELV